MTDKELLELAAKAVGLNVKASAENSDDFFIGLIIGPKNTKVKNLWNPLNDDGDALRLAVDLNISVDLMNYCNFVEVTICSNSGSILTFIEQINNNKHAATRRAIVRAAASIGAEL